MARRRANRDESDPESTRRRRRSAPASRQDTSGRPAVGASSRLPANAGGSGEMASGPASHGRKSMGLRLPFIGAALLGIIFVGVIIGLRPFDDDPIDDTQTETQFPNNLVPAGSQVGKQVPPSSYLTFDGEKTDLTSYEGRPLVVNFWSSTCASCIAEMPEFETIFQRYSTQDDVAFVGINIGDTNDAAKEMVNTTGVTYDIGRDSARAVFPGFGGLGLPTTALVNESGEILAVRTGPVSGQELSEMITEILLA